MKPNDFQTPAQKRTFANGIAVLTMSMIAAGVLEYYAGWELHQIGTSLLSFLLVLLVAIGRFASRSSAQQTGMQERLFITAMWYFVVDMIAKVLPTEPLAAPADSAAKDARSRNQSGPRVAEGEKQRDIRAPNV